MNHPCEEEIRQEIERSKKSLAAAETLFNELLYEDALSRSYYSILHAAKAALLIENVVVSSHDAVKRLFGLHLIKTGKIDNRYSHILREEQDDRFLADYDSAFSPEKERVEKRIQDADDFVNEMIKYIRIMGT